MADMRAALCRAYGKPDVIRIEAVSRPEPKPGEILIRIRASTVSSADWRIRALAMPPGFGPIARLALGLRAPRQPILGTELCGEVAALGQGVTRFKVGDEVVAFPGAAQGCHAEFRTMPAEGKVIARPASLSLEEAAAMSFGGATALHYLRDAAKLKAGERVLVIGASGAVGSAAVQIARALGARVDGMSSAGNHALVRGLGAEHMVDHAVDDVAADGPAYDVVFDTVGKLAPAHVLKAVKPGGRLILIAAGLPDMLRSLLPAGEGRRILAGPAKESRELLEALAVMAEAGQFRPVIDSVFGLDRIAEAHARVDTGRKRGSVVVLI